MTELVTRLQRAFFPVTIAASGTLLLLVGYGLSPTLGIRGSYTLIGLSVAATVDRLGRRVRESSTGTRTATLPDRWYAKAALITVALSMTVAVTTRYRLAALVGGLLVGYTLLGLQLRGDPRPTLVLAQVAALFALSPGIKYATSGFYFGSGDILVHVYRVERIVEYGTAAVTNARYPVFLQQASSYQGFPGYHLIATALRIVADVPAYDAILSLGLALYALVLLPLSYLVGKTYFGRSRLALCVPVALATIAPVSYYASYFFPQALALVLVLTVFVVALRINSGSRRTATTLFAILFLVTVALVSIHHLTLVMFAPIFVFLVGFPAVVRRVGFPASLAARASVTPRTLPLLLLGIVSASYWIFVSESFLWALVWSVQSLVTERAMSASGAEVQSVYAFGTRLPAESVGAAFRQLVGVNGLYLGSLVAAFSLGVVTALRRSETARRAVGVLLVGLAGSVVIFKTPVVFPGMNRVALTVSLFSSIVVAFGLLSLLEIRQKPVATVALAVVVVLGTTGPLVAAENFYSLEESKQKQAAFSEREYQSLASVGEFVSEHDMPAGTLWIDRIALKRFGVQTVGKANVSESGISSPSGAFIYRRGWSDHIVHRYGAGKVYMSDGWLRSATIRNDVVYDSGEVGIWLDRTSDTGHSANRSTSNGPTDADGPRSPVGSTDYSRHLWVHS